MYFSKNNKSLKKSVFKKRGRFHSLQASRLFNKMPCVGNEPFRKKIYSIYPTARAYLELNLLRKFMKHLIRLVKKKQCKVYIFLKPTHGLTQKGKNARMGKGKGRYARYVTIVKIGRPLLQIEGCSPSRAQQFFILFKQIAPNKFSNTL